MNHVSKAHPAISLKSERGKMRLTDFDIYGLVVGHTVSSGLLKALLLLSGPLSQCCERGLVFTLQPSRTAQKTE